MADARVAMLRRVPLFSACTDKQLDFIVTQVEELDFPSGKVLCRQGDSGGDFFVIISGTAEVVRDGRSVRELGAGDFFGEIALIDHGSRTATVTARTALRCLILGPGQFQNVLHQNVEIAIAVLRALGERIRSAKAATAD